MRCKLTLMLAAALLLVGCKTMTGSVGTECGVWQPITWSSRDTPETIVEVKANNARRAAWCGKQKVKK